MEKARFCIHPRRTPYIWVEDDGRNSLVAVAISDSQYVLPIDNFVARSDVVAVQALHEIDLYRDYLEYPSEFLFLPHHDTSGYSLTDACARCYSIFEKEHRRLLTLR
jgi:hypothetical protein